MHTHSSLFLLLLLSKHTPTYKQSILTRGGFSVMRLRLSRVVLWLWESLHTCIYSACRPICLLKSLMAYSTRPNGGEWRGLYPQYLRRMKSHSDLSEPAAAAIPVTAPFPGLGSSELQQRRALWSGTWIPVCDSSGLSGPSLEYCCLFLQGGRPRYIWEDREHVSRI